MGDYSPDIDYQYVSTVADGLSSLGEKVHVVPACSDTHCETYDPRSVMEIVSKADIVFLCLGTGKLNLPTVKNS